MATPVASYLVTFAIMVEDADSPMDAMVKAVSEVPYASANVWSVPDSLDEDPVLYHIESPGDPSGQPTG